MTTGDGVSVGIAVGLVVGETEDSGEGVMVMVGAAVSLGVAVCTMLMGGVMVTLLMGTAVAVGVGAGWLAAVQPIARNRRAPQIKKRT